MKTLFKNARILTMNENEPIFFGSLLVEGNRISYVGKEEPKGNFDKIIDCEKNLLMPGFKNAHAHSAMSFTRSYADDLSLESWLFDKIFPLEARLAKDDQRILSKVSMLEYLTSGITACYDMYFNYDEIAEAAKEIGMRTVIAGTITSSIDSPKEMEGFYHKFNDKPGLVSFQMGFHSVYTTKIEVLKELSRITHELKCPTVAHNSETKAEVENCKRDHNGMTPTEYMNSLGLLDYGGSFAHCVYLSEHDIDLFLKHGCYVVSNPGSNAKLASGIAPLCHYLDRGLPIALGTDGPGSNNGLDFFYEMRLACVGQKLLSGKAEAFDALEALKAATVVGALSMGLKDACTLSKGQLADLILIDLKRPSMQPINNIEKNLVYSGGKDCVKLTMIDGIIRYQDGKFFVNEDIEKIYEDAQRVTERLKAA